MSALGEAAREIDALMARVAALENEVQALLARKDGPPRTAYKPSEVAAMTGWSTSKVRQWIREGRLRAEDMGNGRYAVPAAAALALVPASQSRRSA